jgi:hypothetical protein
MSDTTPTLWSTRPALEQRLRALVQDDLRGAVLDRMLLPLPGPLENVHFPEVLARLGDRLRESIYGTHGAAWVPEVQAAFGPRPTATDTLGLHLAWPPEVRVDDLGRWLTLPPRHKQAEGFVAALARAEQYPWEAITQAFVTAFERSLLGPETAAGASTAALAFEAFSLARARLEATFAALTYRAWMAIQADLGRPIIALDAGHTHHTLLGDWRDLPKTGGLTARGRAGWAELIAPNQRVGVRFDMREIPTGIIDAIRAWRSWHGLRHWAGLQRLLTAAGRTGRVRWNLNAHMAALGYSALVQQRRDVRRRVADEVEALTRLEISVYNPDGSLRVRGPILAITQRGEAQRGTEWTLEGLELVLHPILYDGVRRENGELGTLWAPAPAELAHIDHRRHPYALALGLLLPIRWRWDLLQGRDCTTLTGATLLNTAGIHATPHNLSRAWQVLDHNLEELQRIGSLGEVEWEPGRYHTADGNCRLYPPSWVRDRLIHHLHPFEEMPSPRLHNGRELMAWRRSQGLTQPALAAHLGVSERTLRRAEKQPERPLTDALQEAISKLHSPTPPKPLPPPT